MIRKIVINNNREEKKKLSPITPLYNDCEQVKNINMLFLNEVFVGSDEITKTVKKKLSGYKSQDVKKDRYNKKLFISYEDTLEKLVISKLKCHYCRHSVLIMFRDRREKYQWTLDRLDNTLCHSKDNTVISCLECNLQKRRRDEKKFKFSKQMRLIKEN